MVAGAVLLDTLLRKLDAEEITLCDLALREGLVLDYIHRHRKDIARVDRYPDVRRRSAIELAERCNWEAEHSRQVAALALALFDQTKRAFTAWATASASGWSTPRSCTTSATTSATSGTIAIRTT